MKIFLNTLALAVLFAVSALPSHAQMLLGESSTIQALESTPVEQVQISQLQDVIFLGSNSDQDLSNLSPQLLDIALEHPNEGSRKMAVVGLHAIGNEAEMFKLIRSVDQESSEKVRSTMVRVLNDFFSERYTEDDPRYVHALLLNGQ